MNILGKYIAITVTKAILLVLFVLIALQVFILFSGEFADMGTKNYGFIQVLIYVLLMLPQSVYQFFPMVGLLGSLIGLGQLAKRSELVVMRASGVSVEQIAIMTLKAAVMLIFAAVLFGEALAPIAQHKAVTYKTQAVSGGEAYHSGHGVWVRNGNDFIYIESIIGGNKLANISRYKLKNNYQLQSASIAKSADFINHNWRFYNVVTSVFNDSGVVTKHYPSQDWQFNFRPRLLKMFDTEASSKTLVQLYSYVRSLARNGLQNRTSSFLFWQRVLQPMAALIMILLAIPFVFGSLRDATAGFRIIIGAIIGFSFYTLNQSMVSVVTVYQLPPLLIAILPLLLAFFFGWLMLRYNIRS